MICEEQAVWYKKEENVKRKANFPLCMDSFLQLVLLFGFFKLSTSGSPSLLKSIFVDPCWNPSLDHLCTVYLISCAAQLAELWCLYCEEDCFQLIIFQLIIEEETNCLNKVVSKLFLKTERRCVLPFIPRGNIQSIPILLGQIGYSASDWWCPVQFSRRKLCSVALPHWYNGILSITHSRAAAGSTVSCWWDVLSLSAWARTVVW